MPISWFILPLVYCKMWSRNLRLERYTMLLLSVRQIQNFFFLFLPPQNIIIICMATNASLSPIFLRWIVCSTSDSAKLMLQCINEGAADYILKPLRKDVLKTMFLVSHGSAASPWIFFFCIPNSRFLQNLHRYQVDGCDTHAVSDSSSGSQTVHDPMNDNMDMSTDLVWNELQQHRLREIFIKDSRYAYILHCNVILVGLMACSIC
jgi:hypothetical protein